jgi:hypothetical protein
MLMFQVLHTSVKPMTGMAVTSSRKEPAFFLSTMRSYETLPNIPIPKRSGPRDG